MNRSSGEPIPDEEPLFIFRAKDRIAVRILRAYFSAIDDPEHARAVAARLEDFKRFAREHPERMKDPDTPPRIMADSGPRRGGAARTIMI